MKSYDLYEKLWLLEKVVGFNEMLQPLQRVVTFMKSCNFDEKLWLIWRVATFMKNCDLYEWLWLVQRVGTILIRHNKEWFSVILKQQKNWTSSSSAQLNIHVLCFCWVTC